MSGPFATAANRLTSVASRTGSVGGRIVSASGDVAQIAELIDAIYRGTSGGTDLALQVNAILGALDEVRTAVKRLEDGLRAAATRAAQVTGGSS